MRPKLRRGRVVVEPTRLSFCTARGGVRGANIAIPILNLDPRVVLAISVWVSRTDDSAGPNSHTAELDSGVSWSIYSAVTDGKRNLRPLQVVPGFDGRAVRPADAWGGDSVLRSGDSAELSASTHLLVSIRQADIYETILQGLEQEIWVQVVAFPSDAIAEMETEEEGREAYRGLLEQIVCAVPSAVPIATQAPG